MTINYNVWKIFYLILASAFIVFSILLYSSFTNINQRHHTEVEYYTDVISKTVHAKFLQNEMLLELLGKQLLKNSSYKDVEATRILLDNLLKRNPYLAAFGLVDLNGNIIAASSNIKIENKINILKTKDISSNFEKVINSYEMNIGRTYYFDAVKEWVIPMRKAIRDENGTVLGVMNCGLKNSKNNNYLDTLKLSKDKNLVIILDPIPNIESYRLYFSNAKNISNNTLYNTPIPHELYEHLVKVTKEKYNYTLADIRQNGEIISFEGVDAFGVAKISGITYDKNYKLWIVFHIEYSEIWMEFFDLLYIYTVLFIIVFILFFILFKNIATFEKRKNDQLVFQAEHDILTQLPNRTYMYKHVDKWLQKHTRKYYLFYIDLDNFKNINDKFGHTIGDKILVAVAERLESFFTEDDMLIRQGGDEFIVFKSSLDEENLETVFEELIILVSKVYIVEGKEFRIGMSVGASSYPKDALKVEELLSLADTAMYEAKKRKNSYCLFSENMRHDNIVKSDMEQELRGAIEKKELWMVYQPQINSDETLYGLEALVRWENEKLGFIGPDKFIQVAEETGLIREIGDFIISTSLMEIKNIQSELGVRCSLSINISVIQLMEEDFLEKLLKQIKVVEFDKALLTLEITESQSIEDLDDVLPLLYAIREQGIEISLDDFGTGYSSLSTLRELPINELKIDKSFIDKILYDKSERALVQSIINIGKNFNMKTLAEGVESIEQVEVLREAQCDIFQGYFYSKPLLKKDLVEFLIRKKYDRR